MRRTLVGTESDVTESRFDWAAFRVGGALPAFSVADLIGWGARIRTWECGSQSPVPYRLATPQGRPEGASLPTVRRSVREIKQRRAIHPLRRQPSPWRGYRVSNLDGLFAGTQRREYRRAGTGHPRSSVQREPVERLAYFRVKFSHHRLAVIVSGGEQSPDVHRHFRRLGSTSKQGVHSDSGVFRVNAGARNTAAVEIGKGSRISTYQGCSRATGTRRSPTPSAHAARPRTNNGTSAPSFRASAASRSVPIPRFQSRSSPTAPMPRRCSRRRDRRRAESASRPRCPHLLLLRMLHAESVPPG